MAGRQFDAVGVAFFAKYPTPGLVKTRLMTSFSAEQAVNVHIALVQDQLRRFEALPGRTSVTLWGDQTASAPFYRGLLQANPWLRFRLQRGNDLGCRMNFAFCTSLKRSPRVILVGSDCPEFGAGHAQALSSALDSHDLALIGADDGGYVAIALKRPQPCLFRDVHWGTAAVLGQTLRLARKAGLASCVVDTLSDIDEPADLQRFPALMTRAGLGETKGAYPA